MGLDEAVAEEAVTAMPAPVVAFPEEPILPPPFAVGVFPDMTNEVYHRIEAMSSGGAVKIRQSPQHFKFYRDEQGKSTRAKDVGSAIHLGVLQPDLLDKQVVVMPSLNRYTKVGKADYAAFMAQHSTNIVLSSDDYRRALGSIAAVRAHPGAMRILKGATTELSLFWIDGEYKVPCKCRWDIINLGGGADLKSTRDASPEAFGRAVADYEYHGQAAHYLSGAEHALNETPRFYAFIAVENEPPHGVACYYMEPAHIRAGQYLMAIALERYAEALKTGQWKGYADTIQPLQMPRWALRFPA